MAVIDQDKATLDPSRVNLSEDAYGASDSSEVSRAVQKVELDLEDAPFLMDEEDEELDEALSVEVEEKPEKEKKKKKKKREIKLPFKWWWLAIGLSLFASGGVVVYFVLPSTPPPPPQPTVVEPEPVPEAPVEEPPQEPAFPEETVRLEPFWIEKVDQDGDIRFIKCSFAFASHSPALTQEVNTKLHVLRDAVYYYMKNKSLDYLTDNENMEQLKDDLLTVLNQYLGREQIEEIWIEEYLVK